jgi:hypothetical protein
LVGFGGGCEALVDQLGFRNPRRSEFVSARVTNWESTDRAASFPVEVDCSQQQVIH